MAGVPAGRLSIEIVAEIARLQQDLDKAKRVVNAASKDMDRSISATNDNFGRMTKMSGNAAFAARNLGFQLQDVVTQLSLGQSPMKVFAAQGFQIADALGQMKREAAATGQSMTSMITGSLGKMGPVLLVAAGAAAALGAALKIVQDDLNETGSATLTYSDVALGAFDAVRAFTLDKLGPAFEWLAEIAGTVWKYIADTAKSAANLVIGIWIAVPNTLYAAFQTLPGAVAELFVNMANGAIKAIEDLVNKAVAGLNSFAGMVNGLLGTSIGGVGSVSFGRIENSFAGAGKRAGVALAAGVASGFGDHWGKIENYVRPFAEARSRKRLSDDAEKAGKAAGAKGGKAAGQAMADEWAKAFAEGNKDFTGLLSKQLAGMDDQIKDWEKQWESDFDEIQKTIAEGLSPAAKAGAEAAEANERWNEQLDRTIGYLQQMGGFAGVLGQIGAAYQGLASGDFGGVGGKFGSFLGQLNETQFGKDFLGGFKNTLDDFFGGTGKFTEALGAFGLAVSANQLIGDIFGFKGGPLGIFTSLAESIMPAKKGRATFSGGTDFTVTGNSGKREEAVGGIGASVVESLRSIASALGADLSGFTGTVAIRKDSLRYDPTGQGITKLSKGAIDFGKDEAALVKAIIADAIKDGAFEGLSEGFKAYLSSGDVEARLQDVLSLRGAMDELKSIKDPQGYALGNLDKQFEELRRIANATGEGLADIEELYGLKRAEILKQTLEDTTQIERDRKGLLIQIAELEGRSTEALAMARALEIEAADASLRPLMERIYALQDAAVIEAQAAADTKRIADERFGLEGRLLQAQGDTAALRARELDALDPTNRAILALIFTLEDAKTAADALAAAEKTRFDLIKSNAQADFALQMRLAGAGGGDITKLQRENELRLASDDATRAILKQIYALEDLAIVTNKAAEDAKRIADERDGLEARLLQAQGNVAALRERELAALDPVNRALLQMVFSLEDAKVAAEELAAKQKAIADEIGGLNRQWLELTGQTAKIREMDLAALLSDEARAIQQSIWNYTDALDAQKAAQEAAAQAADDYARRLEDARNVLSAAYERESGALQGTIDKFTDFAATIREFRNGLSDGNPATSFAQAQSRFNNTASMARFGNEASLQSFAGDAQAYLDAARNQAGSFSEYQDVVAQVSRAARGAEGGAMGVAGQASQQLSAMQSAVSKLIDIEQGQISVWDAIKNLEAVQREEVTPAIVDTFNAGQEGIRAELKLTREEAKALSLEGKAANEQTVILLSRIERTLAGASRGDAFAITNDNDDPIYTTAAT